VWVGVAVSLLFSALTFYQGFSNAALSRELEASDALNEVGQVLRKTTESAMVPINDAEIDLEIACHVLEEKVIKLDPDNARSQAYLGLCREEKGQLDEAVAAYHKAIKRDPNDAWSHWRLGSILRDLGRFEEAAIAYRRAIKIHPKFAQAHASWGDLHRDTSHFESLLSRICG
jgi:tetratricopeptide (TPR) repeat protein